MTRILAIMGSGETAPTMVKPHREIFDRLGTAGSPAVMLDTPYGFQMNADDISTRAIEYFATSVGRKVEVARLRSRKDNPVQWTSSLAKVAAAGWVFAGPGSPSYALRQWDGTELPDLLADKLDQGGCLVFASAAALTLGRYTVPVYEIYKVGEEPAWLEGLNLIRFLGPDVAVIPHYNNAEGGNHDTRYCYLGETRLALLEQQMAGGWVLGVDEHTACVFDLEAGEVAVTGNGVVTVRREGRSSVVESGSTLSLQALVDLAFSGSGVPAPAMTASSSPAARPPTALHAEIRKLEAAFDAAIGSSDVDGALAAALELEDTLAAWSGDTTQSDASDRGRAALRRMIARLGELAKTGARDPREVVGVFVEALLTERAAAREAGRFDDADRIRQDLVTGGIEVRDTPDGTVWDMTPSNG